VYDFLRQEYTKPFIYVHTPALSTGKTLRFTGDMPPEQKPADVPPQQPTGAVPLQQQSPEDPTEVQQSVINMSEYDTDSDDTHTHTH